MKVLIVLALVAAASCAPAKEGTKDGDREKRNLIGGYPLQYTAGLGAVNAFGAVPQSLLANEVQQNTVESSNYQTSALKSTSTKSSLVQPAFSAYQGAYPAYQAAYPAYQPSYVSYQQPAYYSAPSVLPVQSQYYSAPSVQYVSQPALYNSYPAYSNVVSSPIVSSGVVSPSVVSSGLPVVSSGLVGSPVVSSGIVGSPVVSSGVVGTDPWC